MNVYFFNFSKRRNSTGRPATPSTPTVNAKLKDGCSIAKPVLEISATITGMDNVSQYNYAYIPDFERYYFVTDWILTGTIASVYLVVDPLASFRLFQIIHLQRGHLHYWRWPSGDGAEWAGIRERQVL